MYMCLFPRGIAFFRTHMSSVLFSYLLSLIAGFNLDVFLQVSQRADEQRATCFASYGKAVKKNPNNVDKVPVANG